jgi:cytochrome c5
MRFPPYLAFLTISLTAACSQESRVEEAPRVDRSAVGPCRDGDPDRERWGTSCLCCHAESFGVAGSVAHDAGVLEIFVRDRDGKTAEMFVNPYDNFFQHRNLVAPLTAVVRYEDGTERTMRSAAPHGSCNACHGETVPRIGTR